MRVRRLSALGSSAWLALARSPYSILSTRMSRFGRVRGSDSAVRAADGLLDRAAQRVVGGGEVVAAAVPGADGLAGHVVEHPARAGFHAELVDAVAEHVVGVAHDDALLERTGRQVVDWQLALVAHGALVAFDVELDAGGEAVFGAVEVVAGADDAVACHGQEGAAERIEVRGGGRVGMRCGALRRPCARAGPSAPPMRCACQVCQARRAAAA